MIGPDRMDARQVFGQVAKRRTNWWPSSNVPLDQETAGAGGRGDPFPAPLGFHPGQAEWIKAYFFREVMPVLTPDRARHRASVPGVLGGRLRRRARGQGRVRPRFRRRDRAGAARAATGDPAARIYRKSVNFRVPVLHHARGMSAIRRHEGRGQLPVPVGPRGRGKRGRDEEAIVCAPRCAASCRRSSATRCGWRSPTAHRDHRSSSLAVGYAGEEDLYHVDGPVNLARLISVPGWARPGPQVPRHSPGCRRSCTMAETCSPQSARATSVHHPYQSFQPRSSF